MKDQYFGDVNDYRKYGLLRALQSAWPGSLLVAWMLTPDDGSTDGRKRSYLQGPRKWRGHDPELYDGLRALLRRADRPAVSRIEGSGLLPWTRFFRETVPDRRPEREAWRRRLFEAAAGTDLVFLDPDNGVEVPSMPVGRKGSSKYVTWEEIVSLYGAGSSVLLYQHFRREERDGFLRRMAAELGERTGAAFVEAFRTAHVLFLLAAQDRHGEVLERSVDRLARQWKGQIQTAGLAGRRLRR